MTSSFHSRLHAFRDDGNYDVTIQVENEKFRCHRAVLAAASEFFGSMFSGLFSESCANEITLHDIRAGPFKAFLDFVYSGSSSKLDRNYVFDLLTVSDFLGCSSMLRSCKTFIEDNLSHLPNVLKIYRYLCILNDTHLLKKLRVHIVKNFSVLSRKYEFLRMSFDEIRPLLNDYEKIPQSLHEKTFHIKDRDLMLDVILRWVHYSREERAPVFEELCGLVDFECLSVPCIIVLREKYKIPLDGKKSLKDCLMDRILHNPDEKTLPPPAYCGILSSSSKPSTIHVFVNYLSPKKEARLKPIWIFSANESNPYEWKPSASGSVHSSTHSTPARSVALGDRLFSFGLSNRFAESYSPFHVHCSADLFRSEALKCPPCKSNKFDMCGAKDRIYWYNTEPHNSTHYEGLPRSWSASFSEEEIHRGIYQYDCDSGQWLPLPKMRSTVADSCLTADDDRVYLIGGRNEDKNFKVQALDNRAPEWQKLPMPNYAYFDAVACTLNKKIYVSDGGEAVERYDPTAGKWEIITSRSKHFAIPIREQKRKIDQEKSGYSDEKRMVPFKNLLWQFNSEKSFRVENPTFPTVPGTNHSYEEEYESMVSYWNFRGIRRPKNVLPPYVPQFRKKPCYFFTTTNIIIDPYEKTLRNRRVSHRSLQTAMALNCNTKDRCNLIVCYPDSSSDGMFQIEAKIIDVVVFKSF